jgi:hypothetical protein
MYALKRQNIDVLFLKRDRKDFLLYGKEAL